MKPITNMIGGWPTFLKVNDVMERVNFNKYLLKPWVKGELVKVVPFADQKSSIEGTSRSEFLKRYVTVMRKDEDGRWTLKYVWGWEIFEPLKKNS